MDQVRLHPCQHEWRGVIEDFVALKPREHSIQCILTHTQNLQDKLKLPGVDVATAVEGGAIRPLLDMLAHGDVRQDALLQRLALKTLICILENGLDRNYGSLVIEAGGIPRLLHLLKLQQDNLSDDVLYILDLLTNEVKCEVIKDQESAECFIEGLGCKSQDLKKNLLKYISAEFPQFMNNLIHVPHRIVDIVHLFRVENADILQLLCDIFSAIAEGDFPNLRDAMISSGFFYRCKDIIDVICRRDKRDATHDLPDECIDSFDVLIMVKPCVEKNRDHALEVYKSGFVECLYPFLDFTSEKTETCGLANWILAYVIQASDSIIFEDLIKRKLVPSVKGILQLKTKEQDEIIAMLLERFLLNSTTVKLLLVPKFLTYLARLADTRQWKQLQKLLVAFKDALEAVQRQGHLAQVSPTVLQCYCSFDKLGDLQNCTEMDINQISVEVVEMLTLSL